MTAQVLPLYPAISAARALEGLYLEHRLHEIGSTAAPFVYGSFVSSLDGRIAVDDSTGAADRALEGLTSANDFRLFQELHAQADCLITHGGYLRALAGGTLGNVLQVNAGGRSADLAQWREENGLPAQPAIVVASASLDFPLPASIAEHQQPLYIATGEQADPTRVEALLERGLNVIFAGAGKMVEGAPLRRALGELGYQCLYLLAGPMMLETMLRDRQLSRLYLAIRHRLLGGERFHTLIHGPRLDESGEMVLRGLYYEIGDEEHGAQWFSMFEPIYVEK